MSYATREAWLEAAVSEIVPLFEELHETVPLMRVSVGWPGGRGRKDHAIGQCWATSHAADGVAQVFISPTLDHKDVVKVLATLTHEMVHVVDDCASGHRGRFAKMAKALGLVGKMTATSAGPALEATLIVIAAVLGPYPHAALTGGPSDGPGKQTTRMIKVQCATSDYIVRMTRRWLDSVGPPVCPCHGQPMVEG